jgi:hypothetical protein
VRSTPLIWLSECVAQTLPKKAVDQHPSVCSGSESRFHSVAAEADVAAAYGGLVDPSVSVGFASQLRSLWPDPACAYTDGLESLLAMTLAYEGESQPCGTDVLRCALIRQQLNANREMAGVERH